MHDARVEAKQKEKKNILWFQLPECAYFFWFVSNEGRLRPQNYFVGFFLSFFKNFFYKFDFCLRIQTLFLIKVRESKGKKHGDSDFDVKIQGGVKNPG